MSLAMQDLVLAARTTLRNPRAGAQMVLDLDLPVSVGWIALGLMAVASTILSSLTFLTSAVVDEPEISAMFANPFSLAILQAIILTLVALGIYGVGRYFGGRGSLAGAVVLTAWLEFVLLLVQVVQFCLWQIWPALAEVLGLVGLMLFIWLLIQFIKQLHGFESGFLVFLMIIATVLTASVFLSVLMLASGVVLSGV